MDWSTGWFSFTEELPEPSENLKQIHGSRAILSGSRFDGQGIAGGLVPFSVNPG